MTINERADELMEGLLCYPPETWLNMIRGVMEDVAKDATALERERIARMADHLEPIFEVSEALPDGKGKAVQYHLFADVVRTGEFLGNPIETEGIS